MAKRPASDYLCALGVHAVKVRNRWILAVGHHRGGFPLDVEYNTKREAMKAMQKIRRDFAKRALPRLDDVAFHQQSEEYRVCCFFKRCVQDILGE